MVFGLIMPLKSLCIMPIALYLSWELPMNFSDEAINPAAIYIVFRTSGLRRIKAWCAGNGDSIGKRRNAVPVQA